MLLERLMRQTGLSDAQLERLAATASNRYKVYQIPKRTSGFRTIEHPSREVKAIQRWLNVVLFKQLPLHPCATAYHKEANIRDNALVHSRYNFTLRVDFEKFFPSFSVEHIRTFLEERAKNLKTDVTSADISFVARMVCRNGALTIGAPSSPYLTNAMMFEFDRVLSDWCVERECVYTRYADDVFVSSRLPNTLQLAFAKIMQLADGYKFGHLKMNYQKTAYLSRRYRRTITGLVITPEGKVSIGLNKKIKLKSDIYKFKCGTLPRADWDRVRGMVAFVKDVEPSFRTTLIRKYGVETIARIEALRDA